MAVELDVTTVHRLPQPLEAAAYYVVSEALANEAKHAHASIAPGTALHVTLPLAGEWALGAPYTTSA